MKKSFKILFCIVLVCVLSIGNISELTIAWGTEVTGAADAMQQMKESEKESVEVTAQAAILANADTGEIIYEKNPDEVLYPASITKLMTAIVTLDTCDNLEENITISEVAYTKGLANSSDVGMQVGQLTSVYECLSGMLIASGNECAYALAEYVGGVLGGDVDTFVQAMNQKASDLGCTSTNYTNPCGFHDGNHYTTARDMMIIARAAYSYPVLMEIIQNEHFVAEIAVQDNSEMPGTINMYDNTHKMLCDDTYKYEEIIGGKTGYTNEAGYTLVTYAGYESENLVCVIMGAEEDNQYKDTTDLFNWKFGLNEGYVSNEGDTSGYTVVTDTDGMSENDDISSTSEVQIDIGDYDYIQMVNLDTGEVLYSKGEKEKVPASGLAGLAAALTVLDYCDIDEVVTVTEYKNQMGSNTVTSVNPNESVTSEYTVGLCLYKIMYMESVPCMNALSNLIEMRTGTVSYSFIKMMNRKLVELGCTNTSLDSVFSLNEKASWTSAEDMAIIFKAAYANEDLRKIIQESNADIQTSMFSGNFSLIKYEAREDISLACVILNGSYDVMYSTADKLLQSGFDYYSDGTPVEKASQFGRYKKYILTALLILLYFVVIINISLFLNRRKKITISEMPGNVIANLMLTVIIIGCPLYLHNKLSDLTMAKAYFLIITTVVFAILYFTYSILRWNVDVFKNFRWGDALLIIYLLGGLIGVILTGAIDDAVFAAYGRYTGYLMDIVYVLIICVAIMCGRQYKVFQYSIPVVVIPLGVLAVLNHYSIDPLNIYEGTAAESLNRYISTIGNVDMFAVFMGVAFVYCGMLFCKEKNKCVQIFVVVSAVIAQVSIFLCSANSGYIGIIVFYVLGLLFLKDRWQLLRYLILADLCMLTGFVLGYIEKRLTVYMPFDSVTQNILDMNICGNIFVILSVLIFILTIIFVMKKDMTVEGQIARATLFTLYGIMVAAFVVSLIVVNRMGNVDDNSLASFLVIGKEWGSQRGYLWKMAIDGYRELSIPHKIFGIGSNNVAQLFWTQIDPYDNSIVQMLDNAHSEYLQVLITHGVVGFVSLYGWIIVSLVGAIRDIRNDEKKAIYAMTIISYLCSAVIGLNVSYVFILLIVILCYSRMKENK